MSDLISREAAKSKAVYSHERHEKVVPVAELDWLPSVEPERKTGKWKEVYAETDYRNGWIEFTCENCEYQHGLESGEYDWHFGDPIPWKFCPICGAPMEVDE